MTSAFLTLWEEYNCQSYHNPLLCEKHSDEASVCEGKKEVLTTLRTDAITKVKETMNRLVKKPHYDGDDREDDGWRKRENMRIDILMEEYGLTEDDLK